MISPVLLACSIVSRTERRPNKSSSSCCLLATSGNDSSNTPRPLPLLDLLSAFLASALFSAMASLMLNACDGLGGGISLSNTLGFVGVADLPVLFVRTRTGLLAVAILDFPGVDGGLRDGLVDDGWGILDISIIPDLRNYVSTVIMSTEGYWRKKRSANLKYPPHGTAEVEIPSGGCFWETVLSDGGTLLFQTPPAPRQVTLPVKRDHL